MTVAKPTLAQVLDPEDEDEDLEPATPDVVESEVEDIDPVAWLTTPYEHAEGHHIFDNGKRIKITAITDKEAAAVQKRAMRPDPRNPRARKLDPLVYRREIVAASMNKAHGFQAHSPGALTSEAMEGKPVGEISSIFRSVMRLSGIQDEEPETDELFG